MSYGQGALMGGVVSGMRDYDREVERREDRAMSRSRQALDMRRAEGQLADEERSRGRRQAIEDDPDLQDTALDDEAYLDMVAQKFQAAGMHKEALEARTKADDRRTKNYNREFERGLGRFLSTKGTDTGGLADFIQKRWGKSVEITRNDDGSYDVSLADPDAGEDAQPQTARFQNAEELGQYAFAAVNPTKYAEHLSRQREATIKGDKEIEKERVKGEEMRKTEGTRQEGRVALARERGKRSGGGQTAPAAVRTLLAKEEAFRRLNPNATDREVSEHLFPGRSIGPRDKLRAYLDVKKAARPSATPADIEAAAAAAEQYAAGGSPSPEPKPEAPKAPGSRPPLESFQK